MNRVYYITCLDLIKNYCIESRCRQHNHSKVIQMSMLVIKNHVTIINDRFFYIDKTTILDESIYVCLLMVTRWSDWYVTFSIQWMLRCMKV